MRILIGNDTDPSLIDNVDVRAWTQRVLWFARNGDVLILISPPDRVFLKQVAAITGVDPQSLTFYVMPPHDSGRPVCDNIKLCDENFLEKISKKSRNVTEISALWPSQHVAHFADKLGLSHTLRGYEFIAQNGGETSNSKVHFRALAAQCGVPIPRGYVCRTVAEAIEATYSLLQSIPAIMVKKAHGGGGGGNQLISTDAKFTNASSGARSQFRLAAVRKSEIKKYWTAQWGWASSNETQYVVLEEFIPDSETVYAEFECANEGVSIPEIGYLKYFNGRLVAEVMPDVRIDLKARDELISYATRLANVYHRIGYRGFLSADAIITREGKVFFTEVNAQYTGSTHLYRAIGGAVMGRQSGLNYAVVAFPLSLQADSLESFCKRMRKMGIAYSHKEGVGVVPARPIVEKERMLNVCAIGRSLDESEELAQRVVDDMLA